MTDGRIPGHMIRQMRYTDLSDEAWRVMTVGITWSNEQGTDGFIPERYLRTLHPSGSLPKGADDEMITAGIWRRTASPTGRQYVGWSDQGTLGQSTAEEVDQNREVSRIRQKMWRANQTANSRLLVVEKERRLLTPEEDRVLLRAIETLKASPRPQDAPEARKYERRRQKHVPQPAADAQASQDAPPAASDAPTHPEAAEGQSTTRDVTRNETRDNEPNRNASRNASSRTGQRQDRLKTEDVPADAHARADARETAPVLAWETAPIPPDPDPGDCVHGVVVGKSCRRCGGKAIAKPDPAAALVGAQDAAS